MTNLSELPNVILRSPSADWDRERWEELPNDGNRYEVIDGVLHMTTAPSSFHQWIVQRIYLRLNQQIDEMHVGTTFVAPIGVFMPGCDPVQPDLVVVRSSDMNMFQNRRIVGVPALLVEVVSPSTVDQDTRIKRGAYARAGVAEYWIVRPASRDMIVCTRPELALGDYTQLDHVASEGMLKSPTLPVEAQVATFFAGAPDTTL